MGATSLRVPLLTPLTKSLVGEVPLREAHGLLVGSLSQVLRELEYVARKELFGDHIQQRKSRGLTLETIKHQILAMLRLKIVLHQHDLPGPEDLPVLPSRSSSDQHRNDDRTQPCRRDYCAGHQPPDAPL
jgi:hypothetical protein